MSSTKGQFRSFSRCLSNAIHLAKKKKVLKFIAGFIFSTALFSLEIISTTCRRISDKKQNLITKNLTEKTNTWKNGDQDFCETLNPKFAKLNDYGFFFLSCQDLLLVHLHAITAVSQALLAPCMLI